MGDIWKCWLKTSTLDGFMIASTILIVLLIAVSVFILLQFAKYSIKLNERQTVKTSKKKMDGLVICTIILSLVSMCFYGWFRILAVGVHIMHHSSCNISENILSTLRIGTSLNVLSYYMALVCYFYRLIAIFEGSLFQISKNIKLTFYITNCVSIIQWITARILILLLPKSNVGYSLLWGVCVYYVFLTIILCVSLKRQFGKLFRFTANISNINNNDSHTGTPGTMEKRPVNININHKHTMFLKVLKRLTVLTYFSLVMTVLNIAMLISTDVIIRVTMSNESKLTEIITTLCLLVDNEITMICLVLQFPLKNVILKWIYAKCCQRLENCSICHNCNAV